MTGDAIRAELAAMFPRPGWKARNLDADHGRVYDLVGSHGAAYVNWDWADHYATGYVKREKVYEGDGYTDARDRAMEAVEDRVAAALSEDGK